MRTEKQIKKNSFLKDVLTIAILTIFIVLPIRLVVAQPFIVVGSSMVPTFESNDYLIVDQLTYRLEPPERYDVVVFRYPNDPSKFFIKRIIGLPGESLKSKNGVISVKNRNNSKWQTLKENYTKIEKKDNFSLTLENDRYYVLGDNRKASYDSRIWGTLDKDLIVGRALIRLFPITKIGLFPGGVK